MISRTASAQCVVCLETCSARRATADAVYALAQQCTLPCETDKDEPCAQKDDCFAWGLYAVCSHEHCASLHGLCRTCVQRFLTDAALDSCPMCRGSLSPVADLCQRYAMERARADYLEREVRQLRDLSEQHANRLHRLYCRDVDATIDLVRHQTATTHKSVWQFLADATDEVTFSDACNDFVTDVRYMSRIPSAHEMRMIVRRAAR